MLTKIRSGQKQKSCYDWDGPCFWFWFHWNYQRVLCVECLFRVCNCKRFFASILMSTLISLVNWLLTMKRVIIVCFLVSLIGTRSVYGGFFDFLTRGESCYCIDWLNDWMNDLKYWKSVYIAIDTPDWHPSNSHDAFYNATCCKTITCWQNQWQ